MRLTTNLGLKKPEGTDVVNIDDFNYNADILDAKVKEISNKLSSISTNAKNTSFDNSSNGMVATNVQDAIEENKTSILKQGRDIDSLKLSVSNGKQLIASAITDKGVDTSNEDSFQIMANNINNISTMKDVMIDGTPIGKEFELEYEGANWLNKLGLALPYNFTYGSAVVLNNEIHILGSSSNNTKHYKYNGSSWTEVSTLPYKFYQGSAVVFNNEIHILGGSDGTTKHYKYNGSSWSRVSTLPYSFTYGSAVVLNNEIHILGSSSDIKHYKYNGSSWTEVSTLPYSFYQGGAVVLNNEIHILGGYYSYYRNKHYKYNGSSWSEASTLPYKFYQGSVVVFNNEIHILGSSDGITKHYKYNGSSWSGVSTLPYSFYNGSAVVFNNEIHILGGSSSDGTYTKHYKYGDCYKIVRRG